MESKIIKNTTNPLFSYMNPEIDSSILYINCVFRDFNEYGIDCFTYCSFQDCIFLNLDLEKCNIYKCKFDNCLIMDSNLNKTVIIESSFTNTQFVNTNLSSSSFTYCEIRDPKFTYTDVDYSKLWFFPISAKELELWKLGKLTKIKEVSYDLGVTFEALNFVSFPNI